MGGGAGGAAGGAAAAGPSSAFSSPSSASAAFNTGGDAGAGANAFQASNSFSPSSSFSMQSPTIKATSPFQQMSNGGDFSMQAYQPAKTDFQNMSNGGSFQLQEGGNAPGGAGSNGKGFDAKKFAQDALAMTPDHINIPQFNAKPWSPIQAQQFLAMQAAQPVEEAPPMIKKSVQGAISSLYPGQFNNLGR